MVILSNSHVVFATIFTWLFNGILKYFVSGLCVVDPRKTDGGQEV